MRTTPFPMPADSPRLLASCAVRSRPIRLYVALALCIVLAGCTGEDDDGPVAPRAARMGGTLELTMFAEDFVPVKATDDHVVLDPVAESTPAGLGLLRCCLSRTLMSYDTHPGGDGRLVPDLAAGVPAVSEDGLTWTFRLRPGLRYAPPLDGVVITSGDIVRALNRAAVSPAAARSSDYFMPISGFEAVRTGAASMISGLSTPDDLTLVIHVTQPTGDLADRLALPIATPIAAPVADFLASGSGGDASYGAYLVSSGPYMYQGSRGERLDATAPVPGLDLSSPGSIRLVRNPSWDPASDPIRSAYVDRVHITIGGDGASNAALVESGAADLQYEASTPTPPELLRRYQDDPSYADRIESWDQASTWAVTMNLAMPPFDDLHVRRAVAFAMNTRELVRVARAFEWSSTGVVATGRLARHIGPDATEADLLVDFDPFPGKQGPERRAKAEAEMARSRYDADGDGRCDDPVCDGLALYAFDAPVASAIAETLRLDLHPIGIELDVKIEGPEIATVFTDERHAPLFAPWAWLADYPNASTFFLPLLSGAAIDPNHNLNLSMLGAAPPTLRRFGYSTVGVPSVDDRIDACLPLSGDEQTGCWALLDKFVMTRIVPWVPFFNPTYVAVASPRVRDVVPDPLSQIPALDQVWLAGVAGPSGS